MADPNPDDPLMADIVSYIIAQQSYKHPVTSFPSVIKIIAPCQLNIALENI